MTRRSCVDASELRILEALDAAVRSAAAAVKIDEIVARVERALNQRPEDLMAREPVPLEVYADPLPPAELIEERPDPDDDTGFQRMKYVGA